MTRQINHLVHLLIALVVLAPGAAFAEQPVNQEAIACNTTIPPVAGNVRLTRDCTYRQTVVISTSDTTLDCNGAVLDGEDNRNIGLFIGSNVGIGNIQVKNCIIRNFKNRGIRIASTLSESEKLKFPRDDRHALAPQNVTIESTRIENIGEVGIFVNSYVTGTKIVSSTIMNSGGVGLYLEQESRQAEISHSTFANNGWSTVGKSKDRSKGREGIAVDSSMANTIHDNILLSNAGGGIFLYKNCHEQSTTNKDSVPRLQPAARNVISENKFHDMPVGIWLASRQSRDLHRWDCGDRYYGDGKYVLDHASQNTAKANFFEKVDRGIVVEDDNNFVLANKFRDCQIACVEVGSYPRSALLGLPVKGIRIQGNRSDEVDRAKRYKVLYGSIVESSDNQ